MEYLEDKSDLQRRTVLDLPELYLIFSQNRLLTTKNFQKQAERRGLTLSLSFAEAILEALHRTGILVPLYRVAKNIPKLLETAKRQNLPNTIVFSNKSFINLDFREELEAGRLFDPRAEEFHPWNDYQVTVEGLTTSSSTFIYSPHQLLLVPELHEVVDSLRYHRVAEDLWSCEVCLSEQKLERLRADYHKNHELTVILSALDRRYLPRIRGTVSLPSLGEKGDQEWEAFETAFDAKAWYSWLAWDTSSVLQRAEHLLSLASSIDPLDDWLPLVRLCRPSKWEKLQGDALVAIDYRIAAEMLLRFYEDLITVNAAPPLPEIPPLASHPLNNRLQTLSANLDDVLMDFGLSPQPSLILFLEGKTELAIMPNLLEKFAIRWPRSFIEVRPAHGIQSNIGRIATYMAPLAFGQEHADSVALSRPPTRFLVVFDPEGAFADKESAEKRHQRWIEEFYETVPSQYRSAELRQTLNNHIEVHRWQEGSFEFAHFTNEELAEAILSACRRLEIPVDDIDIQQLASARERKQSIERAFPKSAKRRLTKPELAQDLWVILERKIDDAVITNSLNTIPILNIIDLAIDQALSVRRTDTVVSLRRVRNDELPDQDIS